MTVRRAKKTDGDRIIELLRQVNLIHHNGRPDLFNIGTKYTPEELCDIIGDETRPILVAEYGGVVLGYAFCIIQSHDGDPMLTDIKTLYLDDLCVDEGARGKGVGKTLYNAVLDLAREIGCHNVTLNVWCLNPSALRFYESLGMTPLKIYMEQLL